jgi:Spy/CpxP family protein refolding chaperone
VNKSLQRCLAKAIAALGLGAYLFQGEDLPQTVASNPAPSAPPPAKDFKKATGMSLEQEIRIAPDMESLKALYNRVSLSLTPEQRALFSQRKQEIS